MTNSTQKWSVMDREVMSEIKKTARQLGISIKGRTPEAVYAEMMLMRQEYNGSDMN